MNIFSWIVPQPITDLQRALSVLSKQKVCKSVNVFSKKHVHFMVGEIVKEGFLMGFFGRKPKAFFSYYSVKFSKNGEQAMISSNGTVDFFFSSKEEVDQIKKLLTDKFGVIHE